MPPGSEPEETPPLIIAAQWVRRLPGRLEAHGPHPGVALGIAGAAAAAGIVAAGGRVGPVRGAVAPTTWLGLLRPIGVDPMRHPWPGLLLVAGIAALVGVWLRLMRHVDAPWLTSRRVWGIAAAWALPLVIGPPLLSNDVFSYAAQGLLVVHHLSPYLSGPGALQHGAALAAVDPRWRWVASPYGPLATAIEWGSAALAHGSVALGVVVLRLVAVAGVAVTGLAASRLAPPALRSSALLLTVCNPVMLLQVVSAAHLDGVLCALAALALLAARRQRPALGVALACAAAGVKAPGLVVVAAIGAWAVLRAPAHRRLPIALRCAAAGVATWLVLGSLVPDGWGWVRGLVTPGLAHTPAAPTAVLAFVLAPALSWTHLVSYPELTSLCRAAGLLLATGIVVRLLVTARSRPLELTAGRATLAVSVLGPVIYPWYLLWGTAAIAPRVQGRERELVVAVTAVAALMAVPGLSTASIAVIAVAVSVTALSWLAISSWRQGRRQGDRAYRSTAAAEPPLQWARAVAAEVTDGGDRPLRAGVRSW